MKIKNAIKAVEVYRKKNGILKTIKKVFNALYNRITKKNSFDYKEEEFKQWIINNEPSLEELEAQKKHQFEITPKISIVVPMYNTNIKYFEELIDSVINQTYSNWELCLADGSQEKNAKLTEIANTDSRIKYKFLDKNYGIAGNSNCALEMATGDYIALLDHDDTLPYFCLYEIVSSINKNKEAEFIYTDEDKRNGNERCEANFKPDFEIDYLRSNNYITHLAVFKKELMEKLEGFKEGYDGAQDYDIILRAIENTNKILHIPKVLYHWRIDVNSTSTLADSKPYAYEAGKRAIQDHLKRQNLDAKVTNSKDIKGVYEVEYEIKDSPKVLIIIQNTANENQLNKCINNINQITTYKNYEIKILEDSKNINKLNETIKDTECDFVMILNSTLTVLTPNWIEKYIGFAQRNDVGAVGGKIYNKNNTIKHAGIKIQNSKPIFMYEGTKKDRHAYFGRESITQDVDAITKNCLFTKKELIIEQNYFNNENYDIVFCIKLKEKGYLNVYNPYIEFKER